MSRATQIASAGIVPGVILAAALLLPASLLQAAEDAAPAGFVSLKLEGSCDAQNHRLWLTNSHTFKTIATTVRWRAAGGKDLTEEFYPGPNTVREIGCAAEAEIIASKFADF